MLTLVVDLGDVFTKGIAKRGDISQRLRFPSVVAHQLSGAGGALLLDQDTPLPRLEAFDPGAHPRESSYPEAHGLAEKAPTVARPRYAGWPAVTHGTDRRALGVHPTDDIVEALVRKALLLTAGTHRRVELVLPIDTGAKASAIERYAAAAHHAEITAWSTETEQSRRIVLDIRARVVDAAASAATALAHVLPLAELERALLIDVGYWRTKLSVVADVGLEHHSQVELGVSDCVLRVLREGQEDGLVADELAVARALEKSQRTIELGGRHFDVAEPLRQARESLSFELASAIDRLLAQLYAQRATACRIAAIVGGGAELIGPSLTHHLQQSALAPDRIVTSSDPQFTVVSGAQVLAEDAGRQPDG